MSAALNNKGVRACKQYLAILFFVAALPAPSSYAAEAPSPTPTPDSSTEETVPLTSGFIIDRPDFNEDAPYYLNAQSRWALGLRFGISGFPVAGALGNTFQIFFDRMFPFLGAGYLSGGLHFGTFPLYLPTANLPYPDYGNAILGAQVRYQFKYSKDALIVPTLALEWEFYQIRESSFDDNLLSGTDMGLSFGIMINAGFIDRMTERDAHKNIGLTRAYFTAELRSANLKTALFNLSGDYWLFGLRLELE